MRFKGLANTLRICLGSALVWTALAGTTYGAGAVSVPEIDATVASSAVTLLVGGYLVFAARARRK